MSIGSAQIGKCLFLCLGDACGGCRQFLDLLIRFVKLRLVSLRLSKQGFPQLPAFSKGLQLHMPGDPRIDQGQL